MMFIFKVEIRVPEDGDLLKVIQVAAQDGIEAGLCARALWELEEQQLVEESLKPTEVLEHETRPFFVANVSCLGKLDLISDPVSAIRRLDPSLARELEDDGDVVDLSFGGTDDDNPDAVTYDPSDKEGSGNGC